MRWVSSRVEVYAGKEPHLITNLRSLATNKRGRSQTSLRALLRITVFIFIIPSLKRAWLGTLQMKNAPVGAPSFLLAESEGFEPPDP